MPTRREFLVSTAAATSAALLTGNALAALRRPNIIFVFADQLRSHVLSCYGNEQISTPHLDRLADEGGRFSNALSTWPVCSPYRAMVLTGLHPMHNGTVANDTAPRDELPTIATACRDAGYDTGYIGKWHLEWNRDPFVPHDRRRGFGFWASRNCSHQYFDSFYCADSPEHMPLPGYEPSEQTRMASEYIRAHRDRPFCLFVSWGPPHDPYVAPDSYMEQFAPEALGLRENVPESQMVHRLLAGDPMPMSDQATKRRANWRKTLEDDRLLRQRCLQGYYASTKALDDCMGKLLKALDETGLAEDTIIAFSSDHGDMMGSHRMVSKQMPLEESVSIPFLLRYPRRVPAGTVSDALLTPIDVMPTLLGLAGVRAPVGIDGLDLRRAARGKRGDRREAALIMKLLPGGNPWIANGVTSWRGVRTKRHTYARLLDRGPWVLFDNEADPYQMDNLIDRPEHAELQQHLEQTTQELMAEADDPGDDATIQAFRQKRREQYAGTS